MLDIDLSFSTPDDLDDIESAVRDERVRRQNIGLVEQEIHNVLTNARENGVTPAPEYGAPWVQPHGAHDSYLLGDEVTHNGKRWASTVGANVWEPGVSGWREVRTDGTFGPYLPPTGQHDAYRVEDVVTFEGGVYRCVHDYCVWSPSEYPAGWQLIGRAGDDGGGEDPEEPEAFPAWVPDGHAYEAGDMLSYSGKDYRVVQAHVSQAGWTPDALPALYERID